MLNQSPTSSVSEVVAACIKQAEMLFQVDLSNLQIRYDLKGQTAGQAGCNRLGNGQVTNLRVRFNPEVIEKHYAEFTKTLPHEIAHIVCFIRPALGKNHNSGWQRVCIQLGGNGERTHCMSLSPGRQTSRYLYTATCGKSVELTANRHNKIQRGHTYCLQSSKGELNKNGFVKQIS